MIYNRKTKRFVEKNGEIGKSLQKKLKPSEIMYRSYATKKELKKQNKNKKKNSTSRRTQLLCSQFNFTKDGHLKIKVGTTVKCNGKVRKLKRRNDGTRYWGSA